MILPCFAASLLAAHAADSYAPIKPFLERYCIDCHGETKQKGEVRLDDFDAIDGALWSTIYDQIHYRDMPPEDELQPSEAELASVATLVEKISRDDEFSIATGYRRLNRREYANTVRDLLGLKKGLYDPAARVFEEEIEHGFDTNAEKLVISNELLLEYLDSAERSLRTALFLDDLEKPLTEVRSYSAGKLSGGDRRYTTNKKKSTVLRGGGDYYANRKAGRVAVAGNYRVTISAAGVDRDNYGSLKLAPAEGPVKMGIGAVLDGAGREVVETFDLKDDEFESYEAVIWIEKGGYPSVSFLNGAGKPAASIRQAIRRRKLKPENNPKNYRGPGVEVAGFKVEGPLDPEWPPSTYRTIFRLEEMPDFEDPTVREKLLGNFLSRSFRRVAVEDDLKDYRDYLGRQYQRTGDWHEAFIKTYAAVMASHDFLYLKEEVGELPPFDLVSRLSYFLWSTMPDLKLLSLAHTGEIRRPDVFAAQVERMLKDRRSEQFVLGFATQWLSLDLLGEMAPGTKGPYSAYYKYRYEDSFRKETLHYFRHVLFENQPVGDFLDSNYAFINESLARAYDLPFEGGSEFQRVALPAGSVRGGLLGHGSILSLTSNGVETLPVTRGHWVLADLLGTPPPPAPAAVPALVPDLTGADTPRAQLIRHREDAACFECHKQMDPIGLALENFDVIGRYREKYEKSGPDIDPAGEMYELQFENVADLRKILRTREADFAKSLTAKLAEYAKGRTLNRRDLEIVNEVVESVGDDEYRFKSLLQRFLISELMLSR
ncbi:MAG: DUF1592 domain-containing protein [Verrucomicrobiales bacterium]|nr:DUF1592 domain-containing protein [Verrucomicrobiales bacterium]